MQDDFFHKATSNYSRFIWWIHLVGDLFIINLSLVFISFWRVRPELVTQDRFLPLILIINLIWVFIVLWTSLYTFERVHRVERILGNLAKAFTLHILIFLSFNYLIPFSPISRFNLIVFYLIMGGILLVWKTAFLLSLRVYRENDGNYKRVIVLGGGKESIAIGSYFNSEKSVGYKLLGYFADNPELVTPETGLLGKFSEVQSFVINNSVDEIFCALPPGEDELILKIRKFAEKNMVRFKLIPFFYQHFGTRAFVEFYGDIPVLLQRNEPLERWGNKIVKRIFDLVFSSLVILLIMSWLVPLLSLIIKITSPGPVFFIQKRNGKNNEIFRCLKFRSMSVNTESDSKQANKNDGRITAIGQFLRKTSLDEMPQFFNVLFGSMTVVGPRPHMLKHTEEYSRIIDKFMVRHLIKPGITGWAQVSGYRGQTEHHELMEKRVQHDVWYLENWSLLLDLKIIFLTVRNMIVGEKNAF